MWSQFYLTEQPTFATRSRFSSLPISSSSFFSTLQTSLSTQISCSWWQDQSLKKLVSVCPCCYVRQEEQVKLGLGIVLGQGGATWRLSFAGLWSWRLEFFSGKGYPILIPCNGHLIFLLSAVPAAWASRLSSTHRWCFWAEFVAGKTVLNSSWTRWCWFSQQTICLTVLNALSWQQKGSQK